MFVEIIKSLGALLDVNPNDIESIRRTGLAAEKLTEQLLIAQATEQSGLLVNPGSYQWIGAAMAATRLELSGKDEHSPEWHGKQLFTPASMMLDCTLNFINQAGDRTGHLENFQMYTQALVYRISKLNAAWQDEQMAKAGFQ